MLRPHSRPPPPPGHRAPCRFPRRALLAAAAAAPPPPPADWDGTAVVLVDHGSKRAAANAALDEFAVLYR